MSHNNNTTTTSTTTIISTTTTTTSIDIDITSTTSTTTESCSVPGFITTKRSCEIDPIVELFEEMVKNTISLPFSPQSYRDILSITLNKGRVQENCNYCCPDCGNIYIFAGKEAFLELAEAIGWTESSAVPA